MKRLLIITLSATAVGVATVIWIFSEAGGSARGTGPPVIEVDRSVDLGRRPLFSNVQARITITNRGRATLVINEIAPNCGCTGVAVEDGSGRHEDARTLAVSPGESAHVFPSFAISGRAGVRFSKTLTLHTNDPVNSVVSVEVFADPVARYFTSPPELALGEVATSDPVRRSVDVMACADEMQAISRVVSSQPQIAVGYLPYESPPTADHNPIRLFGRLSVSLVPPLQPGELSGEIIGFCADRPEPAFVLPVSATIVQQLGLSPDRLMLPRVSGAGRVYEGICLCRARTSNALVVRVAKCPSGVRVRIDDVPSNPSLKIIRVDASELAKRVSCESVEEDLALEADFDGERAPLRLRLSVQGTEVGLGAIP